QFDAEIKTAKSYTNLAEVELALAQERVTFHTPVRYYVRDIEGSRWVETTVGRVLLNAIVPSEIELQNREMKKKALGELVFESYRRTGLRGTVPFLDRLKDFGFRFATRGGISIGIEDLHIPAEKETLLSEAEERVTRYQRAY